ncbi:hypothetical protein PVAP13_4KG301010 [Panicum virgatum]|uniref:Uncharacterized protein n=1 Tax=Panicum virgatum TaxID=38727 RepID=A0A8T0TS52_PANVG|nr:hypothetical protein PVAP13_4KG301010 [Panicum virgatum]
MEFMTHSLVWLVMIMDKLLVLLVLVHILVVMLLLMILLLSPSGDCCLFANGSTRSPLRVALSRQVSKGALKTSHLNQHLHRVNPWEKLSTPFICVTKSWVPKSMLANPFGIQDLGLFVLLCAGMRTPVGEHGLDDSLSFT